MEVVEAPFYDAYYNPCFCQKCVLIVNDLQQKRKISRKIGVFCLFVGGWPFFFALETEKKAWVCRFSMQKAGGTERDDGDPF